MRDVSHSMEIKIHRSITRKIKSYNIMMTDSEHESFKNYLKENNWVFQKTHSYFSPITSLSQYEIKNGDRSIELEVDDWFFFYKLQPTDYNEFKTFLESIDVMPRNG